MKRIWNWIKVAVGIVFAVLVYILFTHQGARKAEIKKKVEEVKAKAKEQEKAVEKIEKRTKSRKKETEIRKKKAKELSEKLKKHFGVFIAICVMVSIGMIGAANSNIENLIIPNDYQELVEVYKEMADIAIGYQRLYNEAEHALTESEADNRALIEVIKNLQSLIGTQQEIIDDLLQRDEFNLFTGINYVPLNPSYSGIILGLNWEF